MTRCLISSLQTAGLNVLLNPELPTHASGSSIDKLLVASGHYIPSTFPPPGNSQGDGQEILSDTSDFPACVVVYPHIGDHAPIMRRILCGSEEIVKSEYRLRAADMTDEEWQQKDMLLRGRLAKLDMMRGRPEKLEWQHWALLHGYGAGCPGRFSKWDAPTEMRRHIRHPEMEYSLTAGEQGDDHHVQQLMRRNSSDGWRHFLETVNTCDTRALSAYLAEAEGRRA